MLDGFESEFFVSEIYNAYFFKGEAMYYPGDTAIVHRKFLDRLI